MEKLANIIESFANSLQIQWQIAFSAKTQLFKKLRKSVFATVVRYSNLQQGTIFAVL